VPQDPYSGGLSTPSNIPDAVSELVALALNPIYDAPPPTDTGAVRPGLAAPNQNAPTMDFRMQPSYAAGGMIGPGGVPQRPGMTPGVAPQGQAGGAAMTHQQMQAEIQRMQQQHPQEVAKIRQVMQQAMQSGDLTPQELNTVVQLATATVQNPQLYPQIRQFAIQQGLATEQDMPQQYDATFVFVILLAAQSMQSPAGGQDMMQGGTPAMAGPGVPQAASQPPQAGYAKGGALPAKARTKDGSVHIIAHEGEYVIPKHVVKAKGTDFFDKLIQSYDTDNDSA